MLFIYFETVMFINLIEEFWSCAHIKVHISLRPVQTKISECICAVSFISSSLPWHWKIGIWKCLKTLFLWVLVETLMDVKLLKLC